MTDTQTLEVPSRLPDSPASPAFHPPCDRRLPERRDRPGLEALAERHDLVPGVQHDPAHEPRTGDLRQVAQALDVLRDRGPRGLHLDAHPCAVAAFEDEVDLDARECSIEEELRGGLARTRMPARPSSSRIESRRVNLAETRPRRG